MCTVTTTIRIIFYHRFKTSTMNSTVSTMSNQIGIFFVDKKINKLSCSLLILSLSNVHTLSHCHSLRLPVDRYTFFSITYWEFPFINRSIQILIIFLFTLVISLVQKKWENDPSLRLSTIPLRNITKKPPSLRTWNETDQSHIVLRQVSPERFENELNLNRYASSK